MDVRAFSWQMIPALAMLNVCCSITYKMNVTVLAEYVHTTAIFNTLHAIKK